MQYEVTITEVFTRTYVVETPNDVNADTLERMALNKLKYESTSRTELCGLPLFLEDRSINVVACKPSNDLIVEYTDVDRDLIIKQQ